MKRQKKKSHPKSQNGQAQILHKKIYMFTTITSNFIREQLKIKQLSISAIISETLFKVEKSFTPRSASLKNFSHSEIICSLSLKVQHRLNEKYFRCKKPEKKPILLFESLKKQKTITPLRVVKIENQKD